MDMAMSIYSFNINYVCGIGLIYSSLPPVLPPSSPIPSPFLPYLPSLLLPHLPFLPLPTSVSVDLWSVGCIMAELFTGHTLFTGEDYADQLSKIFQVVGTPSEQFIQQIPSEPTQTFIHSLPVYIKKPFALQFGISDPVAVDLLDRLLVIDPTQRINAEEALGHPYLSHYSDPEDEPTAPPYDEGFEQLELDTETWRKLVWDEIHSFVPDPSLYHQL